ncbi:PTS transporter subunit EIIB [Vibrio sp. CAU 1672]|uniref:PTS transporter subunit EIIB n=1 Tax=Vibrio sp. CAU 1672 TaxID=3032594 RepID=UPI0023DC3BF6|nr:PTS transporter subunit EIIB [Vibrio sp. CAU 1672]MDF2153033.1 PTS transporter subunit EIIB [Vibrio sp. CAU 1672]
MIKLLQRIFKALTQVNPNLEQDVDVILNAIGGLENLLEAGACATRLRLKLKSTRHVDRHALKQHGAYGIVYLDTQHIQIVYGLKANRYSQAIEQRLAKNVA